MMLTSFALLAQKVSFTVVPPVQSDGTKISVYTAVGAPAGGELGKSADGNYTAEVPQSESGFYNLYYSDSRSPLSLPLYLPETGAVKLNLKLDGNRLSSQLDDPANRALAGFGSALTGRSVRLMMNLDSLSEAEISSQLSGYLSAADSVLSVENVPEAVEQYIRVWAYTATNDALSTARYVRQHKGNPIALKRADLLPEPETVIDNKVVSCFPSAVFLAVECVQGNTIEERIADVNSRFSDPELRIRTIDRLLDAFITGFNYAANYDAGEQQLAALTGKYSLPQTYLERFRERKCSVPGTPFPSVKLVDRDGKTVDFSSFAGKYVYIDMWASWCGPCVREVPHLKTLEKELEGSDVAFVSISIDSDRDSWIERMNALDMHGNQLWDIDGKLAESLNVRGIPHFLLYDRGGKLLEYNMPRPSNAQTRTRLQNLK